MIKYLFFLLFPLLLSAQTYQIVDSVHADAVYGSSDITLGLTGRNHMAAKHVAKSSYDIARISVRVEKVPGDNPIMDFVYNIWSHSVANNQPNAILGTSSSVNAATFPAADSPDWVIFDFSPAISVSANDTIWIDGYTATAAADYCYWEYTAGHTGVTKRDADGVGVWTVQVYAVPQARIYIAEQSATTDTPKRKFGNYSGWGGW